MRKHSDIALLRKMVQQKFKGASETPPTGGFEDIQNLLAKGNSGLGKTNKLFLGLAFLGAIAISSALYFKGSPEPSTVVKEESSMEENTVVVTSMDSARVINSTSPTRKLERPYRKVNSSINTVEETNAVIEADHSSRKNLEQPDKTTIPAFSSEMSAKHTNHQFIEDTKDTSIIMFSSSLGSAVVIRKPSVDTVNQTPIDQNQLVDNGALLFPTLNKASNRFNSSAEEPMHTSRESSTMKFLKADKDLFGSIVKTDSTSQLDILNPALDLKHGNRIKYFYELQTFSAHFKLTDIDTENFISYNQELGWSANNLGLRLGVGMNYLLMRGLSLKAGVRYTHFSKRVNYDVAKRIRDASIPINDQQVPVYHIIENRTDHVRHFGLGIHAGLQIKLGERYLGVEIDYSKSLVGSTIASTNVLLSSYFKLGSFWFMKSIVTIEIQASQGLSAWKNELIQYDLKQIGLSFKYSIVPKK